MYDIFVSYKSDDADRARVLAEAFEKEGYSVWWDHSIPPGKTWAQMIEEAINTSRCVVVLWSENSVRSDWVNKEARKGHQRRVLIPALIDNVEAPFEFEHVQAAKLIGWKGQRSDAQFQQMLAEIAAVTARPSGSEAPATPGRRKPAATTGAVDRLKNPKVLGAIGVATVAAVIIGVLGNDGSESFELVDPFDPFLDGAVQPSTDPAGPAQRPATPETFEPQPGPSATDPVIPQAADLPPASVPPQTAAPQPEVGTPDYLGQLTAQVAQIEANMMGQGFALFDSRTGQLSADGGEQVPLVVVPGIEYAIVGVCDSDCSDIDLEIEDAFGSLLDADYEIDAQPVVYATALTPGSFNIYIDMVNCTTSVCYYGIAVFTRGF